MIYNSSLQHKSANLHQILVFYLANTRAAYKSSLQGALHCCCSLLLFFSFELLFSSLNSIFFSFFKQKQLAAAAAENKLFRSISITHNDNFSFSSNIAASLKFFYSKEVKRIIAAESDKIRYDYVIVEGVPKVERIPL